MALNPDDGVRLLANCVVGLGFSRRGFRLGLDRGPHLIGCDAGSADFGPGFLGSGRDPKARLSVERDLSIMIEGAKEVGAPLVIGSCGGAGGTPHLEGFRGIVGDIAREHGMKLRVGLVHAEQAKDPIHRALDEGRVHPLGPVGELTHEAVDSSTRIVAMAGAGPIIEALEAGVDVVLAGRCADPAIFAPGPLRLGVAPGPAWHAAKSIDKGYLATTQPQRGSPVLATVTNDSFVVEPMLPDVACTVQSVARITMHENPDPNVITLPSGALVASEATYEQLDERRVLVRGSRFERAASPSVKLEGAALVGYRSVMIAGIRDPRLLERFDGFLDSYRALLEKVVASIGVRPDQWTVRFRSYGHNAVLGETEPLAGTAMHEVGLVVDVVAETQEIASAVCGRAGATGSRLDFTGQLGGGGNFAYPFSPNVLSGGPVYRWSVWHTLDVADERDPFRLEVVEV
jgi:Acyclic terpene utilisation family protein AtuA